MWEGRTHVAWAFHRFVLDDPLLKILRSEKGDTKSPHFLPHMIRDDTERAMLYGVQPYMLTDSPFGRIHYFRREVARTEKSKIATSYNL